MSRKYYFLQKYSNAYLLHLSDFYWKSFPSFWCCFMLLVTFIESRSFILFCYGFAGDVVLAKAGDLRTKAFRLFDLLNVVSFLMCIGVVKELIFLTLNTLCGQNVDSMENPSTPSSSHIIEQLEQTNWFDALDGCLSQKKSNGN